MSSATQIWSYRGLIGNLTQRELKTRYKRSVLGWAWSLLNPASTLLIYAVVFGTFMRVTPPVAGNGSLQNFGFYLFAGLVVWNLFNTTMTGSMSALTGLGALLRKVYFPAEAPAVANALAVITQTLIETSILLVAFAIAGNTSWTMLFIPFVLALVLMFALGLGLVLSLFNVYLRDVGYLTTIILNMLFFATPIIYTYEMVPAKVGFVPAQALISLNPMTHYVGAMRDCVYLLEMPSIQKWLGITAVSFVTFFAGWAVFSRGSRQISEEL
jgi:ABC-type polysaccharide/polyol phosphate export permease